ncbi:hypothetical protein WDW86_03465 [Bdellovibrionota bacterium FG-2]
MAFIRDCKVCEFRGYSPELCKMHRRHMAVAEKLAKTKHRRLATFDKKEAIAILEREQRDKMFRDASYSAAVGAVIGSSSGFVGTVLAGGALAAIASPLMVGAAIAGAGIATAMKLGKRSKKGTAVESCDGDCSLSSVFGSCGKKRDNEFSFENY